MQLSWDTYFTANRRSIPRPDDCIQQAEATVSKRGENVDGRADKMAAPVAAAVATPLKDCPDSPVQTDAACQPYEDRVATCR